TAVLISLAELSFLDGYGLGALIRLADDCAEVEVPMVVCEVTAPIVRRVLTMFAVSLPFAVTGTVREALHQTTTGQFGRNRSTTPGDGQDSTDPTPDATA